MRNSFRLTDHECYRKLLTKAGHKVQTAVSTEEALRLLQEQTYDLILLDLCMPGMDGMEFLRRLRRQKHAPEVLMVSGYATIDDAVEAGKLGVFGVLLKPHKGEELLERVNRILDLRREPLISYIRAHLVEIHSREDVARHFHITTRTVSNRIKRYTGRSFHEFLQFCRIQEAQRLLAETELGVKEIAASVGFRSPQVFNRVFQQQTGHSPHQYRQEIRSTQD